MRLVSRQLAHDGDCRLRTTALADSGSHGGVGKGQVQGRSAIRSANPGRLQWVVGRPSPVAAEGQL